MANDMPFPTSTLRKVREPDLWELTVEHRGLREVYKFADMRDLRTEDVIAKRDELIKAIEQATNAST